MSHGKNRCGFAIEAIQRDIATTSDSEIDQPFPKHWIPIFNRTSCLWLVCQYFHACPYCFDGTSSRAFIFQGKEAIESLYISQVLAASKSSVTLMQLRILTCLKFRQPIVCFFQCKV